MEDTKLEQIRDALSKFAKESGIEAVVVEVKFDPIQTEQVYGFIEELRRFSESSRISKNYLVKSASYRSLMDDYPISREAA